MQLLLWALNLLSSESSGGGGLATVAHPDYVITWLEDNEFLLGEYRPLKWQVARKDGTACPAPSAATVHVWDANGAEQLGGGSGVTPDLEPSPPTNDQILATNWLNSAVGRYAAAVVMTIGGDSQVRSELEIIEVA